MCIQKCNYIICKCHIRISFCIECPMRLVIEESKIETRTV